MGIFTEITVMFILFGIATWAAMSSIIIFSTQPKLMNKARDLTVPAAFSAVSTVFGVIAVLAMPLHEFIY